jgi:hypothetical protein
MERIGKGLLTKAKAAVLSGATEKRGIEKSITQGRDLLTLLVKANMATDIPENQRLSDNDVLARTLPSHVPLTYTWLTCYSKRFLRSWLQGMKPPGMTQRLVWNWGVEGGWIARRLLGHCMSCR